MSQLETDLQAVINKHLTNGVNIAYIVSVLIAMGISLIQHLAWKPNYALNCLINLRQAFTHVEEFYNAKPWDKQS